MSDAPETPIHPSPANPEPAPSASPGRPGSLRQRIQIGALVLLVLAIWLSYLYLVLLVVLPLASAWNGEQEQIVSSVQNAGRVRSVSQSSGLWTRALVETVSAYYPLPEAVSLHKNEALGLEVRANQARFLGDRQHRGLKLMSRMGLEGAR
ncbi:hypothetical protein [Rhodoferax ferrireducens]|uniref:hypothetical protein n=1 Tax=Rhodoferax ferrireducens TaxID=192843 RepID=UPI000E0D70A1|nr:hypothetical protein [Rhodoferax ferrireducens]